jgi:hypothetical protein
MFATALVPFGPWLCWRWVLPTELVWGKDKGWTGSPGITCTAGKGGALSKPWRCCATLPQCPRLSLPTSPPSQVAACFSCLYWLERLSSETDGTLPFIVILPWGTEFTNIVLFPRTTMTKKSQMEWHKKTEIYCLWSCGGYRLSYQCQQAGSFSRL